MKKNKRDKRKKQHSARRGGSGRSKSQGKSVIGMPQYYQIPFPYLMDRYEEELVTAQVTRPEIFHRDFWAARPVVGDQAKDFESLKGFIKVIDSEFERIVTSHSYYFWIHLYRRIGVFLNGKHRSNNDAVTLLLVREIMEAYFLKYSNLSDFSDMGIASSLRPEEILGGIFVESVKAAFPEASKQNAFIDLQCRQEQWVITRFNKDDFVNLHYLEGLAYEYWLATARMRAVGKGAKLRVSADGFLVEDRDADLDVLLARYDKRRPVGSFVATRSGVHFEREAEHKLPVVIAQYNARRLPFKEINIFGRKMRSLFSADALPNFVVGGMDLSSFYESHKFLEDSFKDKKGFSLRNLCVYLSAICIRFTPGKTNEHLNIRRAISLYQRGHFLLSPSPPKVLNGEIVEISRALSKIYDFDVSEFEVESEKICEFLTLTADKQSLTTPWSGGPLYIFSEYSGITLVNVQPILKFLDTLFFGIRCKNDVKGYQFEDNLKAILEGADIEVFAFRKEIKNRAGEKREIDIAVKQGSTLILVECKAMEMPLDFSIGNPKTIDARNREFGAKVDQVVSLGEFIERDRIGANYDFSWVDKIVTLVASPFTEWIWSKERRLWLDSGLPRILAPDEIVENINLIASG